MRHSLFLVLAFLLTGCHSTRPLQTPTTAHFRILTYNVNWGAPSPELAVEILRQSGADIICLQETTPQWEQYLRQSLSTNYPFADFRYSRLRSGGGLAFLSKLPARDVAYIPSETSWFDGWIRAFETSIGQVQVVNVHLRPPISDSGSWVSGYVSTRGDRVDEIERFYSHVQPGLPTIVAGDFNDSEHSRAVRFLGQKEMRNALPQFDRRTPTWHWNYGLLSLHRRMDHILYSPDLECAATQVLRAGGSDHFPVEAVFLRAKRTGHRTATLSKRSGTNATFEQ